MTEPHWTSIIAAIGALATPLLVLLLTAVGWMYRQSYERKIKLEEKLRDDRIEIYNNILEPFIYLFMSEAAWQKDKKNRGKDKNQIANALLLSHNYKKTSFQLALVGSDSVVMAFNELFQYFYSREEIIDTKITEEDTIIMLKLLGDLLLQIRRSMGNESTEIDNWGMLEWFITDARKHRKSYA
jgi:hypothetical protein